MTTEVLGNLSFLDVPTVNGLDVLLNAGGTPSMAAGSTGSRPVPSVVGRVYLNLTTNALQYDTGSAWIDIGASTTYTGTANQIAVAGSVLSISPNPILPGTASFRPPVGTTAQRPASPVAGDIRFNSTLGYAEKYTGAYWGALGLTLQVVTGTISATSTTSQIPNDNTAPQSTEGTTMWSTSFTPVSATSRVIIIYTATVATSSTSTNNAIITACFSGTTNLGSTVNRANTANYGYAMANNIVYQPGSTATVTLQVRFGPTTTGTGFCNTTSLASLGGTLVSQYIIMEIE